MKKTASAPLSKGEIREALDRLMASPLMTSAEGRKDDYTGALDAASDVRSDVGPRLSPFRKAWGLKGNVPCVIEDLAFALIAHRISAEELFRLGTSLEAMQLFEEVDARRAARMKSFRTERYLRGLPAGGAA